MTMGEDALEKIVAGLGDADTSAGGDVPTDVESRLTKLEVEMQVLNAMTMGEGAEIKHNLEQTGIKCHQSGTNAFRPQTVLQNPLPAFYCGKNEAGVEYTHCYAKSYETTANRSTKYWKV